MWRKSLLFSLALASAPGQATEKRLSFEVASVRRASDPGDPTFNAGIQIRGASVIARHASLGLLIRAAYGLRARFLSGPDWVESGPTFDIRATLPSSASPRLVPEMFQSLLGDRFKLKFHLEARDRTVYALVLAKGGPKLQSSSSVDESMPGGVVGGIHVFSDLPSGPVWTSPNGSTYRVRVLPDGGGELSLRESLWRSLRTISTLWTVCTSWT
jgi:hypothetical protein